MLNKTATMFWGMCLLIFIVPSIGLGLGIDTETTKTVKGALYRFIPGEVLDYTTTFTFQKPGSENMATYRVNSQFTVLDESQSSASMLCKMSLTPGISSRSNVTDKTIVFALKISGSGEISDYIGIAAAPGIAGEPASLFLSLPTVSMQNYAPTYPSPLGVQIPISIEPCSAEMEDYYSNLKSTMKIADGVELSTYTLKAKIIDLLPDTINLKMGVQYLAPGTNQKIESIIEYESTLVSKSMETAEKIKKQKLELQSLTLLLKSYEKLSSANAKTGPLIKNVNELLNLVKIHEQKFPEGEFSELVKNIRTQIEKALSQPGNKTKI